MKCKYTIEEIKRDWKFSEIENRSLQFLLRDNDRIRYKEWLRRPLWYRNLVRNAPAEQTLIELVNSILQKIEDMES